MAEMNGEPISEASSSSSSSSTYKVNGDEVTAEEFNAIMTPNPDIEYTINVDPDAASTA